MDKMAEMIVELMHKGHAYKSEDGIYFGRERSTLPPTSSVEPTPGYFYDPVLKWAWVHPSVQFSTVG